MCKKLFTKSLLSLLLTAAVPILSSSGASAGILDWPYHMAPLDTAEVVLTTSGETITLDAGRLETELGVSGLNGITITKLPESGSLTLNGDPAVCWTHIDRDELSALQYQPGSESQSASLSVMLELKDSVPASLTIRQSDDLCPPVVTPENLVTAPGLVIAGWVQAWDKEGSPLTASVAQQPQKGRLILSGLSWRYEPYPGKTGKDAFSIVVSDAAGNRSEAAVYPVVIEKDALPAYDDLEGSHIAYSAGKLAQAGLFTGEQLGTLCCFGPDEPVTRGELLCLILAASGAQLPENAVATGLAAGDGNVPLWLRPAVAEGVRRGIVTEKDFLPQEIPTFAEMAVYLVRAGNMNQTGGNPSWSDLAEVPDWALKSFLALEGEGLLRLTDGALHPNEPLTREAMADLLWRFYQWMEEK